MGMIGINRIIFVSQLAKMNSAGEAIDGTVKSWESQGEKSTALTAFSEDYILLQQIIKEYKILIQKDISEVRQIGNEMIRLDAWLQNAWRQL